MITGVCKCADGYARVGSACVDVDECATDNGGCSVNADCINGTGSFTCSCKSGFSGDGTWCAHWVQANVAGPSARSGARMTWDSMREKVVLFGGAAANGSSFGDTWEWNGTGWTDTGLTGPSARSEMGLSYDSVRHVVVLYGGSGNPSNDDTWEYDGTSWQQRSVTGPPGRTSVRMVFDEARGVTVLFGGYGAAGTGDSTTWEWDGTAWAQKLVTGPGPRWSPNLVFDSFRQSVVLNGGANSSGAVTVNVNDTWEFKGTAWSLLTNAGPTPRLDADMVFHPALKKSLVFAGRTGMPSGTTTAQQDTWTLSGTWSPLTTVTAPPARYGHAMAYDRARKAVVVFGGRDVNGAGLADTWLLKE